MITKFNDREYLNVLENFITDTNLPKFNKEKESTGILVNTENDGINEFSTIDFNTNTNTIVAYHNGVKYLPPLKYRIIDHIIRFLRKLNGDIKKENKIVKEIDVIEFFLNLTKSHKELTPIGDIALHYKEALIQAKSLGQTALAETISKNIDVVRAEAHLIGMGLKKYVTEKQVIDFYNKVGENKSLKLTWIKNFARIIPEEIYLLKKELDERGLFDNYVILHYDPLDTGEKLTKKEIEKKKDPILFGLIKDSRKLYFVADWKDEYCELTLDEMFTILGKRVPRINNNTVKKYIDNLGI